MFMFRKREAVQVSTSAGLQQEAKNFQAAVTDVNANYKMEDLDQALLAAIAEKHGADVAFVAGSFEAYLKRNAVNEITRRQRSGEDYTIWNLEQIAEKYGFDLDSLGMSYFPNED